MLFTQNTRIGRKGTPNFGEKNINHNFFSAALGKEIYDYYKYKNLNAWNSDTRVDGVGDFVTTCLAGMTVTMVIPF